MNQNQEIIDELKSLNKKLERFTSPTKFPLFNFLGGTFHSLGTIFGTLIVTSAIIYLFSQFNLTKSISKWFENTLTQINWSKVVVPISPTPTIEQLN